MDAKQLDYHTLLAQVARILTVDTDSLDHLVAFRHASASFSDMTSNQALVFNMAARADEADVLNAAIEAARSEGQNQNQDEIVENVLDILAVLFAKKVYPFITGHVHAQVPPALAHSTADTIARAKNLVALFATYGIPQERVCIKIPSMPESLLACAALEKDGVHTLATTLFSVAQARAAAQAGCQFVAPYFNELRVHFDTSLWKKYGNTATEHPMSSVIRNIVGLYRAEGVKTKVMPASIVTADEVIALATLRPDHLTLSASVLDQLAALPPVAPELLKPLDPNGTAVSKSFLDGDLLSNDARGLRVALEDDAETRRKMEDALLLFSECEEKTRVLVRAAIDSTGK